MGSFSSFRVEERESSVAFATIIYVNNFNKYIIDGLYSFRKYNQNLVLRSKKPGKNYETQL